MEDEVSLENENEKDLEVQDAEAEGGSESIPNESDTDVDCTDDTDASEPLDRRDFDPIRAIHHNQFCYVLDKYLDKTTGKRFFHVIGRMEGAFNHVVLVHVVTGARLYEYMIKVPGTGTERSWCEEDAYMMRNEFHLLQYIRAHTSVPVPEVIGFDDSLNNELGAPYIVMKKLPGEAATLLWSEEHDHLNADTPSQLLTQERNTFLHSLARCMVELGKLQFDKIGMPTFDPNNPNLAPKIGSYYQWHSDSKMIEIIDRQASSTTEEYLVPQLDEDWNPMQYAGKYAPGTKAHEYHMWCMGIRKFLDIIFATLPFTSSKLPDQEEESFVLRHPDLDLQNILTDADGNVTGIIDWDNCLTAPRCVGCTAAVPIFLRRDWFPDFTVQRAPHMTWSLNHWRKIYADALEEAGSPDVRYTCKSAMYQGIVAALYEGGGDAEDVVKKVMLSLEGTRLVDHDQFLTNLGKGWPDAEAYLKEEIAKLLAPS
ncbi:hypothetical protein BDV96DRAFT_493595 [Lophiotrema nucula]|uniref:Aminoglycoside phosphotransferase domain-containing protein n=1 Tax=Lophiotrema nucula TaxID=690887 RepID=A0A6A5Z7P6_9PLEO|nr:hypothetical protein BDV96DRAFT_493595 [Lophiotrema nucula]